MSSFPSGIVPENLSCIRANLPTLPWSFATISLAFCSPIPGSDFKIAMSPRSIAAAISEMASVNARHAALGPTPDTVINCSALKHVSTCEKHIEKAINVNIIANLKIMEYLESVNKKFIYISSDKAIKP